MQLLICRITQPHSTSTIQIALNIHISAGARRAALTSPEISAEIFHVNEKPDKKNESIASPKILDCDSVKSCPIYYFQVRDGDRTSAKEERGGVTFPAARSTFARINLLFK